MQAENWVEKYRPQTLSDIIGNESAIQYLREWAKSWQDGKPTSKAIIIYGKSGIGKCCKGNTLILTNRGIVKIEDIVHGKTDFGNKFKDHGQTNLYDSLYDDDVNNILKEETEKYNDNIKNIDDVISISQKLNYEKYGIVERYDMGESDVVTIKTRIGLEISGTSEHKIVIIDNNGKLRFKKLQDISTADHIAVSYNTNIFNERLGLNFSYRKRRQDNTTQMLTNINYMNPDIAELLGYIIAEGNDGDDYVKITNYDKEIIDRILKICKGVNIEAKENYENEKMVGVSINSVAFKEFVYYLGYRKLAQNKEIPWSILQADKDSQISFMRSLFDGDGTVHIGRESENILVEYNSSSYELCRQLQIMLLNLGIIGRLYNKKGAKLEYRGDIREYEESYRLVIIGGEILKFAKIINFGLSRKKEILDRCVETLENRDRWSDITYPNIEKIVNRLYDELKISGQKGKIIKKWQEDFDKENKTIKLSRQKSISCKEYLKNNRLEHMYQYASGKKQPSIYGLKRILSIMEPVNLLSEYKYLETLSDRFIFDNVITTISERTKVYDVTIDNIHSYIGNSMVNHNTASGHALANDMGWEILELNASDQRTKAKINKNVGNSSKRGTMDGSKRLIILDEADNFYVREDKGGEKAVIELIKNTQQPMILIANEFYDMSYGLRAVCKPIKFEFITPSQIIGILQTIADKEGITYDRGVIEKIAYGSDGDLRGAINDLQAVGQGRSHIKLEDILTGERDSKKDIFKILKRIFQSANAKEAYEATFELDESPEDLIQWISENIPNEYKRPDDIYGAYDSVSKAGIFLGRVRRRQNYSMWKYATVLMTAGVFAAKTGKRRTEFTRYQKPTIKSRLWETKDMRAVRDSLAKKIGDRCHTSIGFTRTDLFPFFRLMMKNASYATYITASLGLSVEELAFIKDSKPEVKEINEIYNEAQSIVREDTGYLIESSSEIRKRVEEEKSLSKYGKAQTTIDNAWGV